MNKIIKRILQIGIPIIIVAALLIPRLNLLGTSPQVAPVQRSTSGTPLPVIGVVAEISKVSSTEKLTGMLYPNEEVELISEISGKVLKIYFDDGDYVNEGKLLLKVDDTNLQLQLRRALAQSKLLELNLDRQRQLLNRESVSLQSLQEMETDYELISADIELLKYQIGKTEIRAPFSGDISFRSVSPGSYLQPSTSIATLTDNSTLKVQFELPDRFAGFSLVGKKLEVHIDNIDRRFETEIYAVDPNMDPEVKRISVRGRFKNSDNLPAGMYISGYLPISEEEFIPIPTEAVVPEMEGNRVWIVKGGKSKSVPIEIAGRDNKNVGIKSGIHVGDTVLTTGLMQLREGMIVDVSISK